MTLLDAIIRRFSWERFRARTLAEWREWDAIGSRGDTPLKIDSLYDSQSSDFLESDPLASREGLMPRRWTKGIHDFEFVRCVKQSVMLEPEHGYAICPPGRLVPDSLPDSYLARDRKLMTEFCGVPSLRRYQECVKAGTQIRYEPQLATLRHPFETNYYHFYIDVLCRLHLMDLAGVDPSIPIVVGRE